MKCVVLRTAKKAPKIFSRMSVGWITQERRRRLRERVEWADERKKQRSKEQHKKRKKLMFMLWIRSSERIDMLVAGVTHTHCYFKKPKNVFPRTGGWRESREVRSWGFVALPFSLFPPPPSLFPEQAGWRKREHFIMSAGSTKKGVKTRNDNNNTGRQLEIYHKISYLGMSYDFAFYCCIIMLSRFLLLSRSEWVSESDKCT